MTYPLHDWTSTVTTCGRICFKKRKVNLRLVFAGQRASVKQVDERIWLVRNGPESNGGEAGIRILIGVFF